MPRPTRIEYENAFYHVMNRGKARQTIFQNKTYYLAFLDTLAEASSRFSAVIHAYCLMSNHYHLIIETPLANISRVMRHVNGVYTQRYNRLKKTDGPLFRGRFKAILVDEDAYLLQLSRYIHRNPVETTKPVENLEEYPWSSYPAYTGNATAPDWLYRDQIYGMLGRKQKYSGYRNYVEAGVDEEIKRYYNRGNMATVLGDKTFRESVYRELENIDKESLYQLLKFKPEPDQIVATVASVFGTSWQEIVTRKPGRRMRNDARKVAMYCMQYMSDMRLTEIAEYFGLRHIGSASRSIQDIKELIILGELKPQITRIQKELNIEKET